MKYSAMALANAFIQRAREGRVRGLTLDKLQLLMFYAQSWHYKRSGEALVADTFCRWGEGPLVPSIHFEFMEHGKRILDEFATRGGERFVQPMLRPSDFDAWDLVDDIIRVFGPLTDKELADLACRPGTAWRQATRGGGPILNEALTLGL
ncbi:Panacea domain-containing protein [Cupriavidus pampae]|uniref:Antitoxin SocA-like Panacea domain-containing protein n=1 Tax=Cupriavidus pampae TaxID=659251 RepID=A0ABM8X626_9BURK|nr:type II toxin-antitoxin system antitoxin SocA domain-containing protein [Cupriavidus pampae]CAG9175393.1 hypothetical protein LMG32289_03305 [Cupriavidus pampae]